MATKFFTNKDRNTLLNKFKGIFEHQNVHFFDALVGFFRSSGYFRIRPFLDKVAEIRILVGIDVDHLISEAARKGLEFNFNAEVTREEFLSELNKDIQESSYEKEVEEGIIGFVEDIISGKLKIKAHPSKELHSKIYIFRPENFNEHHSGSVITGSSNLSEAGLEKNFEFNVELRDFDDVAFALKTFEELWQEAIEIIPGEVEGLKDSTYLSDKYSPFEIYIKLLTEYFGSSIEYDPESVGDVPRGYKRLRYQVDAVNDGYNKLRKHNGFILADVVGLGKTIVATQIAKKFYYSNGYRTKTLIIHPPPLERNWRKTIRDFDVPNVEYVTNGSLHTIRHPEDYDLIIVDEAHKFRSDESERFNQLQKLCKTPRKRKAPDGSNLKKVILVTATPLNNKPDDIRNQLYLFQDSKHSTLEVGSLQHFFRPLIDEYNRLKKSKTMPQAEIFSGIKKIYDEIRVKVLEPVVVRRTRTDIKNTPEYWTDILEQGLKFPDIIPPKQILYQLDDELNELYDQSLELIKDTQTGIKYYRYQAIRFLPKSVQDKFFNRRAEVISHSLAMIMKTLLVKRIDSSFHAFKMSLKRYLNANTAMIKMLESDRVFIAPKLKVTEFIMENNEDELEQLLIEMNDPDIIQAFAKDDFDQEFIDGMYNDQRILVDLVAKWDRVTCDPKYDEFVKRLKTELLEPSINDKGKLVIFSESKETTDYLSERLAEDGFDRVLSVNSSNQKDKADDVAYNFDANRALASQKNDYDIIITTEVLAEGVNMHRANVILNYDIPWNATRLMQRIGRVNRIGTESDKIYIYNFFPTLQADNEIELNKKAYMKLQAFHSALGEDSQIYSQEEEFDSYGLFEKVPEEERDERLVYLQFLRRFREENPDEFKRIKDQVPLRARCGRKDKIQKGGTISFVKNLKRDSFFYIFPDSRFEELTFVEAAQKFEAHITERSVPLHPKHHEHINIAVDQFKREEGLKALGEKISVQLGPNDSRAISFIGNAFRHEFANEMEKEILIAAKAAIRKGKFQKLPRQVNQLIKQVQKENLKRAESFARLIDILNAYPLLNGSMEDEEQQPDKHRSKKELKRTLPRIIISESFS
ncbi:MAG: helicase [Bacteroidia bacterium]|nr:helicase [Bacteroidia bacterium]